MNRYSTTAAVAVCVSALLVGGAAPVAQQAVHPRQQPGTNAHIFAPDQHNLNDGHFVISANRVTWWEA